MSRLPLYRLARPAAGPARRSAFTMAEVIFAIMVLGIGLILLAAAFPVGIKQGEKTQDATNAALIAQHAYDQITKVPASYTRPSNIAPDPWEPLTPPVAGQSALYLPVTAYAGKPLTMGLLDGAFVTTPGPNVPIPDLRVKLIYPNWPPDPAPGGRENQVGTNPTYSDGRPQDPTQRKPIGTGPPALGLATSWDTAPIQQPATFLNVWGYRLEYVGGNSVWQENVQWVYPADRRYYWYAFYRQMEEDPTGYPHPLVPPVWGPFTAKRDAVRNDHISRRTYRVLVVPCKVPTGRGPILTPQEIRQRPSSTPADYATQWFDTSAATDAQAIVKAWTGLAPVRVPMLDDGSADLAYTADADGAWVMDRTGGLGYLATGIANSRIRRGDIMLDAWANVYQIVDMTTNAVRLDRPIPGLPAISSPIDPSALPLWFNPNALGVFPTIVTKQADLP